MKRAIIYDRASSEGQRDNFSRYDAKTTGFELAAKFGYTAELRQEIKSGESITNRPVLQSILDDVAAGKCQAVIVQNISRLSRDQDGIDGQIVKKILRDNGCLVITPEKVYDFENDADDKASDIGLMIARWYKSELTKYVAQGQKARALQGLPIGGRAPFGYRIIDIVHNSQKTTDWAKDESEGEAVRKVFELYPFHGGRGTANLLNEAGYRRREGGQWEAIEVWRIVRRTIYCGFLQWGKDAESRFLRDWQAPLCHRPELAYVSVDVWELCQQVKKDRRRDNLEPGKWAKYPLSGLLACPLCGGGMYGHNTGSSYGYRCGANTKGGPNACPGKRISKTAAEAAVLDLVTATFDSYLLKEKALVTAIDQYGKTASEDELRAQLEAELFTVAESKQRVVKSIAAGTVTDAEAKETLADLRDKAERLNRDLVTIKEKVRIRQDYLAALDGLKDTNIRATLEAMEEDFLRRFLRLIFKPASIMLELTGRSRAITATVKAYQYTEDFQELARPVVVIQNDRQGDRVG